MTDKSKDVIGILVIFGILYILCSAAYFGGKFVGLTMCYELQAEQEPVKP
jgi:hypothetical protein